MIKNFFGKKEDPDQSLEKLIEMLNKHGRNLLVREFNEIEVTIFPGTFENFYKEANQIKNSRKQILCFDHSRVHLSILNNDPNSDYIHANFIDGYQQPNEFIITQAPLMKTCADFWRMIWEQHVFIIIVLSSFISSSPNKIYTYWPEVEASLQHGHFVIAKAKNGQYVDARKFSITNTMINETRDVVIMPFKHWPDHGIPVTGPLLQFREKFRKKESEMYELIKSKLGEKRPPIVVHCLAGLGRSGTFVALDISILKLETERLINVKKIVEKIRKQRYGAVQTADQYVFIYKALLDWAVYKNMIQITQLAKINLE